MWLLANKLQWTTTSAIFQLYWCSKMVKWLHSKLVQHLNLNWLRLLTKISKSMDTSSIYRDDEKNTPHTGVFFLPTNWQVDISLLYCMLRKRRIFHPLSEKTQHKNAARQQKLFFTFFNQTMNQCSESLLCKYNCFHFIVWMRLNVAPSLTSTPEF